MRGHPLEAEAEERGVDWTEQLETFQTESDRFLALLRRYSDRAQFIVITHQKRTMEAADWLYGVSMGGDGVSKVVSRRLPGERTQPREVAVLA